MKYYSKTTHGFYDDEIHLIMPEDAKPITDNHYIGLLEGQIKGKIIIADENALPTLENRPKITIEQLALNARNKRNNLLAQSDWTQLQDTKTDKAWKTYRQSLRDISLQPTFPSEITWPNLPTIGA